VLRIRIPPLRERRQDIGHLTHHLLARLARGGPCDVEPAALDVLVQHDWPGNVRELAHTLERALLVGGGRVTATLLEAEIRGDRGEPPPQTPFIGGANSHPHPALFHGATPLGGFTAAVEFAEKQLVTNALEASGGNKTAAAESIGMKPSTFRDKLAKYGLR
jgi:DNA-binding NtrC family response regulator